ncbi:MAG TPA: Holliday junction branch migration protein RuvA [Candidatus Paceibacterota bacterium]|nr:Holliday junction branch migration protein RuvA [Candidatus Paceibacterota bacterium]HPT17984.1 Holliday junction branch migration protein RuvA [Candidatus Paceibacterota bacterium]
MIGSIKGKITFKKDKFIIVETGGIGYKINISPDTLLKIQKVDEIFFWTHVHIKEDAEDIYGFLDYQELEFFEMLLAVSGIGPRSALTILGIAQIETLKKAIGTGDISYLTKISGIGKKTAEKIVLELRDKIGKENMDGSLQEELDAMEALKTLGYSQSQAREALKKIPSNMDTNKKIKEALKILSH